MKEGLKKLPIFVGVLFLSSCDFNFDTNFSNRSDSIEDNLSESNNSRSNETSTNNSSEYKFEEDLMTRNAYFDSSKILQDTYVSLSVTEIMSMLNDISSQYGFSFNVNNNGMDLFDPLTSITDIYSDLPSSFYVGSTTGSDSRNEEGYSNHIFDYSNLETFYFLMDSNNASFYKNKRYCDQDSKNNLNDSVSEEFLNWDDTSIFGYNVTTDLVKSETFTSTIFNTYSNVLEFITNYIVGNGYSLFYDAHKEFFKNYLYSLSNDYSKYDFTFEGKSNPEKHLFYLHYEYSFEDKADNVVCSETGNATMCFEEYKITSVEYNVSYDEKNYHDSKKLDVFNTEYREWKRNFHQTTENFEVPTYIE